MAYEQERAVAIEAVRRASTLCQQVQRALVSDETLAKKDKSPVTVADFGAQAVVTLALREALGAVRLVGEEEAADLHGEHARAIREKVVAHVRRIRTDADEAGVLAALDHGRDAGGQGRFWTLDPVDGTKGFLRAEQYAVALALIEDGQVVLGVLGCPNLAVDAARPDGATGCLFTAVRGQGATVQPLSGGAERRIHARPTTSPAEATFCESVEAGHSAHDDAARIAALLAVSRPPVRMDSQAKYAAVARGEADIYLRLPTRADYEEKIWDHAAGWLVIREAGGEVTDVRGEPLDFSCGRTLKKNKGVVATNGRLHAQVVAAVRQTLGL